MATSKFNCLEGPRLGLNKKFAFFCLTLGGGGELGEVFDLSSLNGLSGVPIISRPSFGGRVSLLGGGFAGVIYYDDFESNRIESNDA